MPPPLWPHCHDTDSRATSDLSSHSRCFSAASLTAPALTVGRQLGAGSFGLVYRGTLTHDDGSVEEVVLKRARDRVQDAKEFGEAELHMNRRLRAPPAWRLSWGRWR